jgi:hypothetical protein
VRLKQAGEVMMKAVRGRRGGADRKAAGDSCTLIGSCRPPPAHEFGSLANHSAKALGYSRLTKAPAGSMLVSTVDKKGMQWQARNECDTNHIETGQFNTAALIPSSMNSSKLLQ